MKVTVDNVKECWELYEIYMEEYRKTHYSDNVDYDDFVDWCENELYKCPNCGDIVRKDEQVWLHEAKNSDGVCDDCIENGGYYE